MFDTRTLEAAYGHAWRDHFDTQSTSSYRQYVRRVVRAVGQAAYPDASIAELDRMDSSDWVTRMSCVEDDPVRPHMHDLWFFRVLPPRWRTDPNLAALLPVHKEVCGMRELWPFGRTAPVAIRTGVADPWAKLGWVWPKDDDLRPIEATHVSAVGAYIGKYTSKSNLRGKSCLRLRATRNFGLGPLRQAISQLSLQEVRVLERQWPSRIRLTQGLSLPTALLRRELRLERFLRSSVSSSPSRMLRLSRARLRREGFVKRLLRLQTQAKRSSADMTVLLDSRAWLRTNRGSFDRESLALFWHQTAGLAGQLRTYDEARDMAAAALEDLGMDSRWQPAADRLRTLVGSLIPLPAGVRMYT